MSDAKYIVGIDLGTTNSILAYTAIEADFREIPAIHILEIPQLVGSGAAAAKDMLPSFIYLPDENEIASEIPIHPYVYFAINISSHEQCVMKKKRG